MCYINKNDMITLYGNVLFKFVSLRVWIGMFFPKWNVEYLVSPNQQYVLDMSLFFVHNAKRLMPLSCSVEEGKVITVNQKKDHILGNILIELINES